ncbi:MAG: Ig-like domain-containing protein, partial [Gammaproteobacteria bacterium]|nr:Ig-like domain-containing protein [Gammaproteobacteria bacterium]
MKANTLIMRSYAYLLISSSILLTACGVADTTSTLTLDPNNTNTQPKPDAVGVSITAPLSFAVKEALDPTSVNETNVHLMPGEGHNMDAGDDGAEEDTAMLNTDPIPGTVTYDPATKTIKFTPKIAMDQGRMYHIHTSSLLLKGGKALPTGTATIKYSFTTSHAHEYYRKELDESGQIAEQRYTDTTNNVRAMRTVYEGPSKILDYKRHYGQHAFPGKEANDTTVYWQQDGPTGGIQRYEVKRKGSDNKEYTVRVRFNKDKGYPQSANILTDPIQNIWTAGVSHG